MDSDDGNIDIILRISHMLALALRREDADNFLTIYDTLIPQGFTNNQVENIKEKARDLAELPEEEFKKVCTELDMSDTEAKMSKSQQAFMNSISRTSQGNLVDSSTSKTGSPATPSSDNSSSASSVEDSDSRNGAYWDYSPSPSSLNDASHSSAKDKVTVHNPEKVPVKKDKVLVHQSIDHEKHMNAAFDYCPDKDELFEVVVHSEPSRKATRYEEKNSRIQKQNEMGYDEVYIPEQEDPRRVAKTVAYAQHNDYTRKLNDQQFDESYLPDDGLSRVKVVNLPQQLPTFTPLRSEDKDEQSPNSSPQRNIYAGVGRGMWMSRGTVDQTVNFFGQTAFPRASEGTKISSDVYPKTERLLGSSEIAPRNYGSLEEGCARQVVEDDSVINNNIDSKKKKKKKKPGKDDSGGKVDKSTTNKEPMDVNGNPVIGKSNNNSDNKSQRLPVNRSNGPLPLDDQKDSAEERFDLTRDIGSMPSASDAALPRRKKKKQLEGLRMAQDLFPNNCGNKSVDDLLQFIENDNGSKIKKDKSKANQNTVQSAAVAKTATKKIKKSRSSSLSDSPKESEVGSERGEDASSRFSEGSELKDLNSEVTQSEVSSVDLNHKMPTSPHTVSLPAEEELLPDMDFQTDNYKFTDKDSIAAINENEFQVVCKKKKQLEGLRMTQDLFPNNCGNKPVDDLHQLIENDNGSKIKKDKSKANQNTVPSAAIAKTATKKVKKSRSSSLSDSPKESEVGSERGEDASSRFSEGSELKDLNSEVTQSEVSSVDLNHKMPTSPSPVSLPALEELLPDMDFQTDNYKFTDKDSIAAFNENEFQVVCKKKKPKSTGPVTSSHREHYDHHFNHFTREPYHRHVPVVRSITPPPKSSSRPDKRERAFSPSAFPELGGNARGCEGRRNSTGNVQCEVSPDDSDLESVKSLPTGTCNDLLSTCPVISYAKMAAKPRQTNGIGLVAPALSSSKAAGEEKTVAEEDSRPTPADVCPPASQSPELPTLNDFPASNNCDLQTSCRSISKAKTPTVSSQEKDLPASNRSVASSRDTTPICDSGDFFAKDNSNKFDLEFVGESHIQSNDEGSKGGPSNSAACSRGSSVEKTLTFHASELRPAVSNSVDTKASSNNAQCSMQNVSKPVENNHKKSTACSVIFMDRPAQDGLVTPSPKFDISFGFEDPCDNLAMFIDKVKDVHKANGLILPSPPQGSPGLTFLGPETDLVREPYPEGKAVHCVGEPFSASGPAEPAARDRTPPAMAALHPVVVPEHLYDPKNDRVHFALEDTVYYIRREWDRLTELACRNPNKVIIYSCD